LGHEKIAIIISRVVQDRDKPIYRPGRYIRQIFGFWLTKRSYSPHAFRQLAQESTTNQVKTVILQQC